jgi:chaperone required for assembly of F1-ATPase
MSGWTAKRFWKEATVGPAEGGFAVLLDGRGVKTPAKRALVVPTEAMARAIADEWDAQGEKVDPATMPVTRSANAALDKVATQFDEVAAMIAEYGGTDLLCYRAEAPDELVARQAAGWDPLLDWAEAELGVRLAVTAGVLPKAQSEAALARMHAAVAAVDPFRMAALHDLVGITGSLVLGLAVARGRLNAVEAWALSRIDEDWQAEQWGEDEEAAATAAIKQQALAHAAYFWGLCGSAPSDAN